MQQALRCGCTVAEFWEMTPRETYAVIAATNWQERQRERQQVSSAWLTASLSRSKRIPRLKVLLAQQSRPKRLSGKQLQERRQEFKEIATPEKIERINAAIRKAARS